MREFEVKKLVRDKILDNIHQNELAKTNYRVLEKREFLDELKNKFYEELEEFDPNDTEKAKEELADLQLIIDYFSEALKVSRGELKLISKKKNEKAGAFDKKIFLETVELDEKDEWLSYYEKKFKELK